MHTPMDEIMREPDPEYVDRDDIADDIRDRIRIYRTPHPTREQIEHVYEHLRPLLKQCQGDVIGRRSESEEDGG